MYLGDVPESMKPLMNCFSVLRMFTAINESPVSNSSSVTAYPFFLHALIVVSSFERFLIANLSGYLTESSFIVSWSCFVLRDAR